MQTKGLWIVSVVLAGAVLSACSKSAMDVALEEDKKLAKYMAEREERRSELQIERGEEQLSSLPSWVINKPQPDGTGMYGTGIGESRDLTNAIRKSNLQARFDVAKEIENVLTAEETMTGSSDAEYRYIVNSFVDQVNMAGVEDVMREVQSGPRGYRAYTLVKLPYDEFNEALSGFNQSDQLESAYAQLMERVAASEAAEQTGSGSNSVLPETDAGAEPPMPH